jgi:anion-transporting  ArsA/GET3 family ATPase
VINNVLKSDDCEFCRLKRKEQEKYIGYIRKKFGGLRTVIIPAQPQEVKGVAALENFKKHLCN